MALPQRVYDDEEENGYEANQLSARERANNRWGMNPNDETDEQNPTDDLRGSGDESNGDKEEERHLRSVPTGDDIEEPGSGGSSAYSNTEASDPGTPFKFRNQEKKKNKNIRSAVKKHKKKSLYAGLAGFGVVVGLIIFIFNIGSLKIPHLMANITAYQFARVSRNFGDSVAQVTEEKIAVDSENQFAKSLKSKYDDIASKVDSVRERTWGKLDKYRPQKVIDNMHASGELKYIFEEKQPKLFPELRTPRQVLTGVEIDGKAYKPGTEGWSKYFGKGRAERLKISGQLQAQIESTLKESNTLVRGSVGASIREELGIRLKRWEKLTKAYRNAKAAKAAEIKATYEAEKTRPTEPSGISPIQDGEEVAIETADNCVENPTCLEEAGNTDIASVEKKVSEKIGSALSENSLLNKATSFVSSIYAIALPVCMIYEASVTNSGSTVEANNARNMKAYYTLAAGADQQKYGKTPGGSALNASQVGGLNDELGNIANAPSELRASGKAVSANNYPNPEASTAGTYTIADALLGDIFGGVFGDIFNEIAKPSCPIITEPAVGGIMAAAEAFLTFTPIAGEAYTAAKLSAEGTIQVLLKKALAKVFSREGFEFTKDFGTKLVRDGALIVGGSYLAKAITLGRMGSMQSPVPNSKSLAVQADQGGSAAAAGICREQLYCRPMTKPEIVQSNFDDTRDIAYRNSRKSIFERFLSPNNPTSALTNTAVSLNTALEQPITSLFHNLITKIGGALQPDKGVLSLFLSATQRRAVAAVTNDNYNMVQWGWTPDEEAVIEANPDIYSPLNNAEIVERSGKLDEYKASFNKCFTEDIGSLLADLLIQRNEDGIIDPNNGTCAPNNLGTANPDAFSYRVYMRNQAVLDHLNDIQSPTSLGTPTVSNTTPPAPISVSNLNGYTVPCGGQPAPVRRLTGPRADWTGVPDSGTIGTNSAGQPIKVYIREACDTTNLKTIFIGGGIHGTENGGGLVGWDLLFNAELPSNVRIIAIPEINASGIQTSSRRNSAGVDLNRNEDYDWNKGGTFCIVNKGARNNCVESCQETSSSCPSYRGPSVGSESETKAIDNFLLSLGRLDFFIIYHDNVNYVAPVGNTPISIGDAYAKIVGMTGQNRRGVGKTDPVTQHGSLDAWYNKQTGTPTLLIELSQNQGADIINLHVNALQQLLKVGGGIY